jgi:hypothetical protein
MNSRKWLKLVIALLIASTLIVGATQRFDTIIAKKVIITGSGGLVMGVNGGAVDLNGKELTLDTDADTSMTANNDDQINWEIGGSDIYSQTATNHYFNGKILDLDADQDTSLTADADDEIDIEIGGSDVFSLTASTLYLNAKTLSLDADQDTTLQASVDNVITFTVGAAAGYMNIATGNLRVGDGTPTFTQDGEDAYVEGVMELGGDFVSGAQATFAVVQGVPITPTGWYNPVTSTTSTAGQAASDIAAPTDDTIGKQIVLHNINASQVITFDGAGSTVECKADVALGAGDTATLLWNGDDWNCLSVYDNS